MVKVKHSQDNEAIDRCFRRLRNDVVFALVSVTVVQVILTLLLMAVI